MGLHVVLSNNSRAWVGDLQMDRGVSLTGMIGSLMCFAHPSSIFGDYFAVLGTTKLPNSAVIERVSRLLTHWTTLIYDIGEG